jgi:hypothetical protein
VLDVVLRHLGVVGAVSATSGFSLTLWPPGWSSPPLASRDALQASLGGSISDTMSLRWQPMRGQSAVRQVFFREPI